MTIIFLTIWPTTLYCEHTKHTHSVTDSEHRTRYSLIPSHKQDRRGSLYRSVRTTRATLRYIIAITKNGLLRDSSTNTSNLAAPVWQTVLRNYINEYDSSRRVASRRPAYHSNSIASITKPQHN